MSPELALLNVAAVVYAIAIFLPVLRLHRPLAVFAGALATVEWLVSYRLLITPELASHPALSMATALERGALLCFCGMLASRMAGTLYDLTERMASATLERERVRRAFGSYVAEPVVQRVLDGELHLATERREVSVLFVDIRDFTSFSTEHPPDEVFRKLNLALEAFTDQVGAHGGVVNKFLGDGLMALFGAPLEDPQHARRACQAALAIAAAAATLRDSGAYPELRIGVGLHCGEVVIGDVGGAEHREYTAIGDVVNVSSRVQEATRELGAEVLATGAFARSLGEGVALGRTFHTRLRDRGGEMVLHEVLAGGEG